MPPDAQGLLDRVITLKQAAESTGLSVATLRRLIDRGDGPSVTQLSVRRFGFRESHLIEWLDSRIRNGDDAGRDHNGEEVAA